MSNIHDSWMRVINTPTSYDDFFASLPPSNQNSKTPTRRPPNVLQHPKAGTNSHTSLTSFASPTYGTSYRASEPAHMVPITPGGRHSANVGGSASPWNYDLQGGFDVMGITPGYISSPIIESPTSPTRVRRNSRHSHTVGNSPYPLSNEERMSSRRRSTTQECAFQRRRTTQHKPCKCCLDESPCGPTNCVLVPQVATCDAHIAVPKSERHLRYRSITFQLKDFPELGVKVGKILEESYPPKVVGGETAVLNMCDREIKICLQWPGYGSKFFQKRMKTHGGTVSRDHLLLVIANAIEEYLTLLKTKEPSPGNEEWAIGRRPDGSRGIQCDDLFITKLIHRGGSNWQPEIWTPRMKCPKCNPSGVCSEYVK